jgi:hypothetical protein
MLSLVKVTFRLVLPSDESVVVMAAHWQRELAVAGAYNGRVSLERVF